MIVDIIIKKVIFLFPLLVWMERVPSNAFQFVLVDFLATLSIKFLNIFSKKKTLFLEFLVILVLAPEFYFILFIYLFLFIWVHKPFSMNHIIFI